MKKTFFIIIGCFLTISVFSLLFYFYLTTKKKNKTIKVGILHSLTGPLATSEQHLVKAAQFAINKINNNGGLLHKKIIPIIVDGKSDSKIFAQQAEALITKHNVVAIFGCWTSASRKAVKPIVEKYNSLLFYPVQYEGIEQSPNIFYLGSTPNQQILPAIKWAISNLNNKFFLVGSEYIFPKVANEIIKEASKSLDAEIVGEEYLPLGSKDIDPIITKIKKTRPGVILNTINGDTNKYFFKKLQQAGITPEKIPVISFSISHPEFDKIGINKLMGHYLSWGYFENINSFVNEEFIIKFKEEFGTDVVISDPMEVTYIALQMWAKSVKESQTTQPHILREYLKNQAFNAPEGLVHIDQNNQHCWRFSRIGKIQSDGSVNIVWESYKPIRPIPYLTFFRNENEWNKFSNDLFIMWGKQWEKPVSN